MDNITFLVFGLLFQLTEALDHNPFSVVLGLCAIVITTCVLVRTIKS